MADCTSSQASLGMPSSHVPIDSFSFEYDKADL